MSNIETPYFLIRERILQDNIEGFRRSFEKYWPNYRIGYSVKTNSLPWIIKWMHDNNVHAEVVSDEEYELATFCGFSGNNIVFNGPIKTDDFLNKAFNEKAIVNIDSERELEFIKKHAPSIDGNLGIRININPDIFSTEDVGFQEDGFRFGFCEENGELFRVIQILEELYGHRNYGLHLHVNSISRSPKVYSAISNYAGSIIDKYNLHPPFIDIGGGFFGGVPGKATPSDYLSVISSSLSKQVDKNETTLIIEPGSAAVGSCVELHTTVIDVKDTAHGRIVTTDGSRVHIDPLWQKSRYLYRINSQRPAISRQVICGYTCMDHDRLMILENESELSVGDTVIYERVGNYTMTFGGLFIRYLPDVYVESDGSLTRVRKRIDVSDYYKLETC